MAHFLAISVTVLDSQNTQLLHHLHLNKMRILIKQTIPCMMMLSSLCFRKFPVLRSKAIQSGKCPNTWINLLDEARTAPLTLLQHTKDPLSSTAPLNQTPKRSRLHLKEERARADTVPGSFPCPARAAPKSAGNGWPDRA